MKDVLTSETSCAARWPPQYAHAPADRRPISGQFVVRWQELPTAYMRAKFEDRSFFRLTPFFFSFRAFAMLQFQHEIRSTLGRAHVPPTKVFRRLAVYKTILKLRVAAATGGQYVNVRFSPRNKILRCSAYTI